MTNTKNILTHSQHFWNKYTLCQTRFLRFLKRNDPLTFQSGQLFPSNWLSIGFPIRISIILFLIKTITGWFLLARYVDLLRVWSLHISWNRCNTFFSTTIGGYLLHLSMSSLWGRERFLRCDILREKIDQKIFLLYKQITEIVYCSTFL